MDEKTVFQPRFEGLRPGVRLNGVYEIERLVAQGGMGEVYRSFNIQTRDPVAIKIIRGEMSQNEDLVALFRREASTLFNLHHEAIVRYFVFSVDPELQRAYLAMEFVDGPSLAKRIGERPLSIEEARILVARIGGALDAAHRLGVIHRDLSPDNIILPDGDVRKAKLIDFGIARSLQSDQGTIIGDGFAGKYNYVSPEQLGLAGGVASAKSDIYSFGLVLAEALGGRAINMSGTTLEVLDKRRRVPDLASVPAEFRPLLESLLQPDPADRPVSMAAVAAALDRPALARPASAQGAGGGGRLLPLVAIVIVLVSLAGLGYAFRDELENLTGRLASQPEPVKTKPPPPLPSPSFTPTPSPTSTPTTSTQTPTPEATKTPKPPRAEELLDAAPPRAPSAALDLPVGAVGQAYHADLPAFADPGGKGLKLAAENLPEGLTFKDRGDGSSEISGAPKRSGPAAVTIVATNHNGRTAELTANLGVSAVIRTPQPSQNEVTLAEATVGRDYNAALPPFRPGNDQRGLTLRSEPEPPAGIVFSDAGAGFSQLSGRPEKPGVYSFDVVSGDANGPGGRMTVRLTVAPGATPIHAPIATAKPFESAVPTPTLLETPTPTFTQTPNSDPDAKARAFLKSYDGGACFLAAMKPSAPGRFAVDAVAGDRAAFERFEEAFKRETGGEPEITGALLAKGQCPLIELLRLTGSSGPQPPTILLDGTHVDAKHALSGRVTGLAGRRLQLVLVDNDGAAYLLKSALDAGGENASFNVQLQGDAQSVGKLQALLAIASDGALSAFAGSHSTTAGALARDLKGDWSQAGAAAALAYFWFER